MPLALVVIFINWKSTLKHLCLLPSPSGHGIRPSLFPFVTSICSNLQFFFNLSYQLIFSFLLYFLPHQLGKRSCVVENLVFMSTHVS